MNQPKQSQIRCVLIKNFSHSKPASRDTDKLASYPNHIRFAMRS
ncbi:hypothetical protein ACWAU0_04075 [Methylomonas sp. YC3]